MARIKIKDLPKDMKVTKEEMRKIYGGIYLTRIAFDPQPEPPGVWTSSYEYLKGGAEPALSN